MAFYRCMGGGSGEPTETVLWENSSPTSSFAAQTVTLSQDMNDFDYLKITVRLSINYTEEISEIIPINDFKSTSDTAYHLAVAFWGRIGSQRVARSFFYISDTTVKIDGCAIIGAQGTQTAWVIPIKISGLKF